MPHPIDTAVWSTFEIVVKRMRFTGHMYHPTLGMPIVIAQMMGSPHTRLLTSECPQPKSGKLWPTGRTTAAAEAHCQKYLLAEMRRAPDRAPKSKTSFLADCQSRFPGLSERGFDRVWANAIFETGAQWAKPGRPKHHRAN